MRNRSEAAREREEREAAALRENLRRRKAQQQAWQACKDKQPLERHTQKEP